MPSVTLKPWPVILLPAGSQKNHDLGQIVHVDMPSSAFCATLLNGLPANGSVMRRSFRAADNGRRQHIVANTVAFERKRPGEHLDSGQGRAE
jgi:hypothetical protein